LWDCLLFRGRFYPEQTGMKALGMLEIRSNGAWIDNDFGKEILYIAW